MQAFGMKLYSLGEYLKPMSDFHLQLFTRFPRSMEKTCQNLSGCTWPSTGLI